MIQKRIFILKSQRMNDDHNITKSEWGLVNFH